MASKGLGDQMRRDASGNYYIDDILAATKGMSPQQIIDFSKQYKIEPSQMGYIASHGADPAYAEAAQQMGFKSVTQRADEANAGKLYGDTGYVNSGDLYAQGTQYQFNPQSEKERAGKKSHLFKAGMQKLGDYAPALTKAAALTGLGYGFGGAAGLWDLPGTVGAAGAAGGVPTYGAGGAIDSLHAAEVAAGLTPNAAGVTAIPGAFANGAGTVANAAGTAAGGGSVPLGVTGAGGGIVDAATTAAGTGGIVNGIGNVIKDYGPLIGAGLNTAGTIYGANSAADGMEEAAKTQAEASLEAQRRSQEYQEKMLGQATDLMNPYLSEFAGADTLGEFKNFNKTGMGGDIMEQMRVLGAEGLNLDYKSDPAYQWRQQQQEEALNRQLAGRGMYDSRYGMDVLADSNMNLSGQEADKQYGRAVDEYNRQYGDLSNRYNLGYQDITNRVNLGSGMATNLAGMYTGLGSNVGNQILSTGLSSAGNTAQLQSQASKIMGDMYKGLGGMSQEMLADYRMQPYLDKIMEQMAKPRQTFG